MHETALSSKAELTIPASLQLGPTPGLDLWTDPFQSWTSRAAPAIFSPERQGEVIPAGLAVPYQVAAFLAQRQKHLGIRSADRAMKPPVCVSRGTKADRGHLFNVLASVSHLNFHFLPH